MCMDILSKMCTRLRMAAAGRPGAFAAGLLVGASLLWWQTDCLVLPNPEEMIMASSSQVFTGGPKHAFDIMTVALTPTCVNYQTIMNALKYLKPQGLRKIFVCVPKRWVKSFSELHEDVIGVDESLAVPGVSFDLIAKQLDLQGFGGHEAWNGRVNAGWYLMQFLNLGFGMREDVLDFVLLHDADQMVLSNFRVWGPTAFTGPNGSLPTVNLRPGGLDARQYDPAHYCLLGEHLENPSQPSSSYTSHSWMSFRPHLAELLAKFGGHRSEVSNEAQPWLERIVSCINRKLPQLGFGEIASYISHTVRHHPDFYFYMNKVTWRRNPVPPFEPTQPGNYCCPTAEALEAHAAKGLDEYLGTELGHEDQAYCGYRDPRFRKEAYPPSDHDYWRTRSIHWRADE
ncbi:unnamed protein product [Effrenium voratum]|uniref:Uncharacterized protein n=1 Tax=Effrenium voratum TaxID=2562239 RepID=A0AA36NEJ6_9DINO|nr:unnamed protein product [Effrenium voratum]